MAAIKIHAYVGSNTGAGSCDFRGENAIGHEQGDEHRTIFEIDPATEEDVAAVLQFGPQLNAIIAKATAAAGIGGGSARIGVWDN